MAITGQIQQRPNSAPTQTQKTPVQEVRKWLKNYEKEVANALPKVMDPARFMRITLTAVTANPKLASCTSSSFIGAMLNAAQLGLEPNSPLGQAYLIPYQNKDELQCQFQIGYKGMIALAYRSGSITSIEAHEIYQNDEFEYELGLNPVLKHKPALMNRGEVIAYYAIWHAKDGGFGFSVMSKEDIKKFASKKSQAYKKGWTSPWKTDFDAMAKKTCIKQALKYAPMSTELATQFAQDETIKNIVPEVSDMTLVQPEAVDVEYEEVEEEEDQNGESR